MRFPLRSIDRSRWIGIRNVEDTDYIAVRFSFNKKLISFIDQLRSKEHTKLYDEKEKIHYFPFNESNVYKIISMLKEKNFNIESDLEKIYEKVQMMQNNKKDYIPGIYGFKLKNLNLHFKIFLYIEISFCVHLKRIL